MELTHDSVEFRAEAVGRHVPVRGHRGAAVTAATVPVPAHAAARPLPLLGRAALGVDQAPLGALHGVVPARHRRGRHRHRHPRHRQQASHWRHAGFIDRALFDPTSISLTGLALRTARHRGPRGAHHERRIRVGLHPGHLRGDPPATRGAGRQGGRLRRGRFVVSEAVSFTAFFVGQAILSGSTPTATPVGQHEVLRAVIGGGLFLTVLGLFALGLAAIIRHTAGAITTFVSILLILPLVVSAFPATIGHPIGRYLPATIGSAMTSTTSRGRPRRVPTRLPVLARVRPPVRLRGRGARHRRCVDDPARPLTPP